LRPCKTAGFSPSSTIPIRTSYRLMDMKDTLYCKMRLFWILHFMMCSLDIIIVKNITVFYNAYRFWIEGGSWLGRDPPMLLLLTSLHSSNKVDEFESLLSFRGNSCCFTWFYAQVITQIPWYSCQ
jgi:hypothetical protein